MYAENEKSRAASQVQADTALRLLGVGSVVLAFAGQAGAAAGAGWPWRSFFAIAAALLDIVFSFEFFARLFLGGRGRAWALVAAASSSVVPLLLGSGPFLFAWAEGNLASNAIRGFYADPGLAGALATAACFRLVRLALPAFGYRSGRGSPKLPPSSALKIRRAALSAAAAALILGAAADAYILPTHAELLAARRLEALSALSALSPGEASAAADAMPDLSALRLPALAWSRPGARLTAPELSFVSAPGAEAWFSARDQHRARGLLEAALSALALAAWLAWTVSASPGRPSGEVRPIRKPADGPAGTDELNGLLGKR